MTTNKLDYLFGPVGTISGKTIFLAGVILIFFSLSGLILILFGAFVGFTYKSIIIDFESRKVKPSTNIFGIIPWGKWVFVHPDMKVSFRKTGNTWRTYSRGNRSFNIADKDYFIFLCDSKGTEIIPLLKTNDSEKARLESEKTREKFGLKNV